VLLQHSLFTRCSLLSIRLVQHPALLRILHVQVFVELAAGLIRLLSVSPSSSLDTTLNLPLLPQRAVTLFLADRGTGPH